MGLRKIKSTFYVYSIYFTLFYMKFVQQTLSPDIPKKNLRNWELIR